MKKSESAPTVLPFVAGGVILQAMIIHHFAMNLPMWNEWDFLPIWQKYEEGRGWLSVIMSPYKDTHNMFFPFLVFLGTTSAIGFKPIVWMYMTLSSTAAIAWLLLNKIRLTGTRFDWILVGLGAALVFSIRQIENILWGWQLALVMAQACAYFAIWILAARNVTLVMAGAAFALALVGSFSFGNGLLIWFVGFLQILCRDDLRKRSWLLSLWSAGTVGVLLVTVFSLASEWFEGMETGFSSKIHFAITLLGSTFAAGPSATAIGAILLAAFAFLIILLYRMKILTPESPLAFWFWVAVFSILSAGLVASGRASGGVEVAVLSRYVILSLGFTVGSVAILGSVALDERIDGAAGVLVRQCCFALLGCLFIFSVRASVAEYLQTVQWGSSWRALNGQFESAPGAVTTGQALGILENDPDVLADGLAALKAMKLGPFEPGNLGASGVELEASRNESGAKTGSCSPLFGLDSVAETPYGYYRLTGWTAAPPNTAGVREVSLVCDGELLERALYGLSRPDVAKSLNFNGSFRSGWQINVIDQAVERLVSRSCVIRVSCVNSDHKDHPVDQPPFDNVDAPAQPAG